MPDPSGAVTELSGWKEIAAYLRVSVRTAQTLEKEQGLPIRRGARPKGPVYAVPAELDNWRQQLRDSANGAVQPLAGSEPINRRGWLGYAAVALASAGAIAAVAIGKRLFGPAGAPVSCAIEGNVLTGLGLQGAVLWQRPFPEPITKDAFGRVQNAGKPYQFIDLDGDGRIETLFSYLPVDGYQSTLYCLDAAGKVRWQFQVGRAVTDNLGYTHALPYKMTCFRAIPSTAKRPATVIVVSTHHLKSACQVAVLDGATGKLISEYWHRGHLRHMDVVDLDGDGEPEVLLGGVNDAPEYKRATLLVFDHRNIAGATRHPQGGTYFPAIAPGTEKRRVFFARTARSLEFEFNIVRNIWTTPARVIATTAENIDEVDDYWVSYELDYALKPIDIILSGPLERYYGARHEPVETIKQRLAREVDVRLG